MMKFGFITGIVLLSTLFSQGQSSGEVRKQLQRLDRFEKVLYVAAHPDDENTRVISWLSRGRNAYVRYLSLTRGDGGQNMIGTELGPYLGILRTQELLAARRIDGGTQAFTRAVDFGYSKTAEETLSKWNHDEVLSDVVRAIRTFRPDVIVTRFPPDDRGGHGHHTASSMLAIEAFKLAGDESAFPEQLETLETWQPRSIYWNTYSWRWDPNLDSLAQHDPAYFKTDIGGYDPYLGVSYNELGSLARSQHKCQGFGVSISRGETFEYFQHLDGEMISEDLLENVHRTWTSAGGTRDMELLADAVAAEFNPEHPEASLQKLLSLRDLVETQMSDDHWRELKLKEIDELIAACAGIFAEVVAPDYSSGPDTYTEVTGRIIVRSVDGVQLTAVNWDGGQIMMKKPEPLPHNEFYETSLNIRTPEEISQPYWLKAPFDNIYGVSDPSMIGTPENEPVKEINFRCEYNNTGFHIRVPVDYRWSDRVEGEQRRPFVVTPRATATLDEDVLIFTDSQPKTIHVRVRSFEDDFSTAARLELPEGWSSSPLSVAVDFDHKNEEKVITFDITPPQGSSTGSLKPVLDFVEQPVQQYSEISYSHIPTQVVFGESSVKLVRVSLAIDRGTIGYIQGAGDEVDLAIQQMGFPVERISETDLASISDLNRYQSIVIGIRAYNVHPWLLNYRDKLMKYVENGGNLIVQYNTATRDLLTSDIGPYPFTIGRDRVTEEDAPASVIDPAHPYFNKPNKIGAEDFDGWVQERGLYFATEWDDHYQPLISWHDKDEPARIGGLIFAPYGNGSFTYVGISFFRELPAGVPGAFRLLANILSYEN